MGRDAQCFLLERSGLVQVKLRRYTSSGGGECPHIENWGYHQASYSLPEPIQEDGGSISQLRPGQTKYGVAFDDPRWPTHCLCGFKFDDSVAKQVFEEDLLRRQDTDELVTIRNVPHGGMWYAEHYGKYPNMCGPDEKALMVKVMGHDWHVDGRASNCTMPTDNTHRCWIRHGTVPNITVDKQGHTCQAGAGSIWVRMGKPDGWHGFLRNGRLEEC